MKKIFALLLTILILVSIMPAVGLADTVINKINIEFDTEKVFSIVKEGEPIPADLFYSTSTYLASYNGCLKNLTDGVYVKMEGWWICDPEGYCGTKTDWVNTHDGIDLTYPGSSNFVKGAKYGIAFRLDAMDGHTLKNDLTFTHKDGITLIINGPQDNSVIVIAQLGSIDEINDIFSEPVIEDETPVEATQERIEKYGIPTVFIGEERPEIKVLTNADTYEYNENQHSAEAKIIIENGRTYLGLRDIAYSLGIDPMAVKWNENTKTASISKSGAKIELAEGSNEMKITYKGYIYSKEIDSPVFIRDGRTYVPFRAVFEQFGYEVNWDNETRIITCK